MGEINSLKIEDLRVLCTDETIMMTDHVLDRISERDIKYDDIKQAILSGEIIEQYPDDYPYPSYLILGLSVENKQLHAVIGMGKGKLWVVTAYYPSSDKWEDDYRTRKTKGAK